MRAETLLGSYGYSPDEIATGMVDHRLYRILDDLMKPAKVPEVTRIKPMRSGARRPSAAAYREEQDDFGRLRRSGGRIDDAVSIIQRRLMRNEAGAI